MKTKIARYIALLLTGIALIFSLIGCSQNTSASANTTTAVKEISVFAGSASKPPLDKAAIIFEKNTGINVNITYGGSGAVLSQMILSKTGDVYIPGSPDFLAKAEQQKAVDPESAQIVAYLIPVISVPHGNPSNIQALSDLAKPGIRVGIGNPSTVCVGLYAIEILDYNHLLNSVYNNIVTQAESCSKTASLVALKSVDAVVGWDVFHAWNPDQIDTVYIKPDQLPRIAYIPAAVSNFTRDKNSSEEFINFLTSQTGQEIFKKAGYIVTENEARKFAPNATVGGEYQLPADYKALVK